MIDTCDSSIATWAGNGDSFVVKNVDKFSVVSERILIVSQLAGMPLHKLTQPISMQQHFVA
jgi:hypothetical protein